MNPGHNTLSVQILVVFDQEDACSDDDCMYKQEEEEPTEDQEGEEIDDLGITGIAITPRSQAKVGKIF